VTLHDKIIPDDRTHCRQKHRTGHGLFRGVLGNHLDVLSHLPWIRHDHCWYWGDLDRHGFTLLSRARSMISRLRSLLMASGAIEAYRPLGVEEDLDRYDQPDSTLTLAEASALAALELTGEKIPAHRTRADSRQ
jgi:hypothetical protein